MARHLEALGNRQSVGPSAPVTLLSGIQTVEAIGLWLPGHRNNSRVRDAWSLPRFPNIAHSNNRRSANSTFAFSIRGQVSRTIAAATQLSPGTRMS